jgi:hypothetical protein
LPGTVGVPDKVLPLRLTPAGKLPLTETFQTIDADADGHLSAAEILRSHLTPVSSQDSAPR